jgi:hypothetical protein
LAAPILIVPGFAQKLVDPSVSPSVTTISAARLGPTIANNNAAMRARICSPVYVLCDLAASRNDNGPLFLLERRIIFGQRSDQCYRTVAIIVITDVPVAVGPLPVA